MGVWDQARDYSKNGEWLNFHVSGALSEVGLVQGNESVDLLVDVQILDQALT